MAFRAEPHIERAQGHLSSGEPHRLRYACLELRFALERIAYQKLQLRLPEVSQKEIAAWQPKRIIAALMELVDPMLGADYTLSVGKHSDRPPQEDDYTLVGTNKGVDAKSIGKHWHKLGSFLHMTMPTQKGDYPKEPEEGPFREFLAEVLTYVKDMTSTSFDMVMSEKVSFACGGTDDRSQRPRTEAGNSRAMQ